MTRFGGCSWSGSTGYLLYHVVEWQPDWPASPAEVDEWARATAAEGMDDPGVLQMIEANRPLTPEKIDQLTAEQDRMLATDPDVTLFERVAKMRAFRFGLEEFATLDEIQGLPEDDAAE
jgi:hypothetical protein